MSREDRGLRWLELADFRRGIVHNLAYHGLGGSLAGYGPGAAGLASMAGTSRCIGLPTGGLGPLPRQDVSYARISPGRIDANQTQWSVSFFSYGPIVSVAGITSPANTVPLYYPLDVRDMTKHPVEFFFHFEGINGLTTSDTRKAVLLRDRLYNNSTFGVSAAPANQSQSIESLSRENRAAAFLGHARFTSGRLRPADPTQAGFVVVAASWNELATSLFATTATGRKYTDLFIDPSASPAADNVFRYAAGDPFAGVPIFHQNRLVVLARNTLKHQWDGQTTSTDAVKSNEEVHWTKVNDTALDGSLPASFSPEITVGYGAAGSLNASDLLLIKHWGGAVLVQADITFPLVRRLPGVIGTNGTECQGASTPAGFVYGRNRDGVYAWAGGDGSRLLSPQLPPDFWIHPDTANIIDFKGGFAGYGRWVLAPNGWLYDIDLESWWRLDDPSTFAPYIWQVNPVNGYIYGAVPLVSDDGTSLGTFLKGYTPAQGATTYTWQSQPLFVDDPNRIVRIRELVVIAQGTGTVQVDLENFDGSVQSETFTLSGSASIPQVMRKTTASRGLTNARVKFTASGSGSNPAPVIYAARLAWEEAQRIEKG
jgi:hypothetical protein